MGHGLRGEPHHRRLGITPDPEGNPIRLKQAYQKILNHTN